MHKYIFEKTGEVAVGHLFLFNMKFSKFPRMLNKNCSIFGEFTVDKRTNDV